MICEARHFCMMMRGVEKQHSGTMTSAMLGAFRDRERNARRVPVALPREELRASFDTPCYHSR